MYSIFPKDEDSIFIDIKHLLSNIEENETLNLAYIFYCINDNSNYPYVSFILNNVNNELCFYTNQISKTGNIQDNIENIQSGITNFILNYSQLKYFFDVETSTVYVFCEYKKVSNIINFEQNEKIYQVISCDIVNYGEVYNVKINSSCIKFFLRYNYLLYVKDHANEIKFPTPISVYKGTKRIYLNDILLFGNLRLLNSLDYTYTDFNEAINDSYKLYALNMDYVMIIFYDVTFNTKSNFNICKIIDGTLISAQNKKLAKVENSIVKENSKLEILEINYEHKILHVKVKKENIILEDTNHKIYPYYEKIIENKNRILLKYIAFTDDLIKKNDKKTIKDFSSYFDVDENKLQLIDNKYFHIKNNSFTLKTNDMYDVSLFEYMNM